MTRNFRALMTLPLLPLLANAAPGGIPESPQAGYEAVINAGTGTQDKALRFDWPMLSIGTGEYEEGPTGVTVFRFGKKVHGAVDVAGGAPGTVNTDFLRLGYDAPDLDAVVFAGGSWYGLEATTAVGSQLKDDGVRSGYWDDIALSVGAIIYDFGGRRLNEVYPDKRLAQAAARAAKPGVFPLGAHGAGRMAMTGGLFGCEAHSGQGGAFRQIGQIKIAAFTVVNALGVVVDRDGKVVACNRDATWPEDLTASRLMAQSEAHLAKGAAEAGSKNTTVSLVVTNVKMSPAELSRLARQVHSSMTRGLQPFQTMFDGDVLYAVSTDEIAGETARAGLGNADLGTVASEAMWDAILASVPAQPTVPAVADRQLASAAQLGRYAGSYAFSPSVSLQVVTREGRLYGRATGRYPVFAVPRDREVELQPVSASDFTVPGRVPLLLRFDGKGGIVANPGAWAQAGRKASR